MFRYISLFLLPAVMLLLSAAPVDAQYGTRVPGAARPPSFAEGITGPYVNNENGGFCYVYRGQNGYLFVDEAAQRVNFLPINNNQLQAVPGWGMRVPDITVTVGRDGVGRIVLRFDAPGVPPGFWVSAS
jgi:hypothetical protein